MLSIPVACEHGLEARAFTLHSGLTGGSDWVVDGGGGWNTRGREEMNKLS